MLTETSGFWKFPKHHPSSPLPPLLADSLLLTAPRTLGGPQQRDGLETSRRARAWPWPLRLFLLPPGTQLPGTWGLGASALCSGELLLLLSSLLPHALSAPLTSVLTLTSRPSLSLTGPSPCQARRPPGAPLPHTRSSAAPAPHPHLPNQGQTCHHLHPGTVAGAACRLQNLPGALLPLLFPPAPPWAHLHPRGVLQEQRGPSLPSQLTRSDLVAVPGHSLPHPP